MARNNKHKTKLASTLLTMLVVFLVIWAGPSAAIVATLTISDGEVEKGDEVSFLASVKINSNERAPVDRLLLIIEGATYSVNCTFDTEGTIISGCQGVEGIDDLSDVIPSTSGHLNFNVSGTIHNLGYGYGLGMGEGLHTPLYNLTYNITLNTSGYPASLTPYTATLTAVLVNDTGTSYTIDSSQVSFNITYTAEANETIPLNETFEVNNSNDTIVYLPGTPLDNISIPSNISSNTSIIFDLSNTFDSDNNSILNASLDIVRQTSTYNYSLYIPANIRINSTNSSWDGSLILPTVKATAGYAPPNGTTNAAIEIGFSGGKLYFNNPVKIVIGGMAGKSVFWNDGTRHLITTQCNSATNPTNVPANGECYKSSGSDMIIWTYHFTVFAAYTPAVGEEEDDDDDDDGGSSSLSDWRPTYYISDEFFEEGFTRDLKKDQRFRVKVDGESHYIGLISLTSSTATLEISSEPMRVVMLVGEEAKFDVTGDGYYDIYMKLNSIVDNKASLTVKHIYESMRVEAAEESRGQITGSAVAEATDYYCGDGLCTASENEDCSNCVDCACAEGSECVKGACVVKEKESPEIAVAKSKISVWAVLIPVIIIILVVAAAYLVMHREHKKLNPEQQNQKKK